MDILFISALIWFFLGFAFHAGLQWYNERQAKKLADRYVWHTNMDRLLWDVARKQRNRRRVLDAVREVTKDRADVAWKN